ncbi:hypothetical protein HK096_005486, partial [Nowakowskiella sp. JEL0078]
TLGFSSSHVLFSVSFHSAVTTDEAWALLHAQNAFMVVFVAYMAVLSSTFVYRTQPVWASEPAENRVWGNRVWCVIAVFSVLLQVGFTAVSLVRSPIPGILGLPWWVYVGVAVWPVVFVPVQEVIKRHDAACLARGMHSPL